MSWAVIAGESEDLHRRGRARAGTGCGLPQRMARILPTVEPYSLPAVVRGQSREKTWDLFQQAVKTRKTDELPLLPVDSESLVEPGHSSWQHLAKEGWKQPVGSSAVDAFLMICTMETWILAGWQGKSNVKKWANFERVEARMIFEELARVSGGRYQKGPSSFRLLGETSASEVAATCRSAQALVDRLRQL